MHKFAISILSSLVLTGCAAPLLGALTGGGGSTPPPVATASAGGLTVTVPPTSVLDEAEPSTKVGLISPAALLAENGQLDVTIIDEQCKFHTPDPPFLIPSDVAAQKGWVFTGRLDDEDHLREVQAMEYRSLFGWGWPKQQLNSWPLAMTTLSDLPEAYLEQRLTMLANAKLDKPQQDNLAQSYIDDSKTMGETVARLEKSYNPDIDCIEKK